jgi:hypothetical protein
VETRNAIDHLPYGPRQCRSWRGREPVALNSCASNATGLPSAARKFISVYIQMDPARIHLLCLFSLQHRYKFSNVKYINAGCILYFCCEKISKLCLDIY